MKKNYILLFILTVGFCAHSQVGINTTDPKTTLDVNGAITNRETSFEISGNAVDINAETSLANITGTATGIVSITALTPLINGYRLIIYNNTDGGYDATFYGTTISNSQSVEFIYADSSWKSTFGGTIAGGHSLYNSDGSLTGNRTVNQGTNNLTFSGTGNTNFNNGNVGIGTLTPSEKLDVSGKIKATNFQMSSGAINGYVLASDATGTATWTKSFLPYTANGVNSATTATRDLNDWVVTKGTSIITTDVLANSTNKPDGLGAWFNTGIQSISNGYYSQFLLTDQEAFFRGNTVASIDANQWRTIPNFLSFNKFQYNVASTTADSDLTLMKTGNYAMAFGTNNLERMRITNAGNVGIGTSTPATKLDVAAGTTTTNTVVNATGSINDFLQFNVQNTSTGIQAQSGYSATANNGSATTGFAWMGINNSAFNYPTAYNIGGANDVSFVGSGQDLYLANANNTKSIIFSTGKSTTPFFDERMRITNAGNVGIGTAAPNLSLDVTSSTGIGTKVSNTSQWDHLYLTTNTSSSTITAGGAESGLQFKVGSGASGTYGGQTYTTGMTIMPSGNVGVGTLTPATKLDVAAGTTTTNTVVNATGSINDFLQFNVQNTSTGTQAQSGYSATANNGSATTGFAWMGINNSAFNYPTAYNIGGANDVSFVGSGQDLYLANANNTKSIIFSTGKSTTPFFNERMKITNAGFVGIGTTTPLTKLDLLGVKSTGAGAGTGGNNDAPSQAIIPAGNNGSSRLNDWPAGWGGGISTFDIVGASTFMSGYVTRSDSRLKNDIKSVDKSIVSNFMKIRPVTYFMKEQTKEMEGLQYGFIAQEIRDLFPSMVTKTDDPNGVIGMNYQALISPTIYVVQQQQAKIDELQKKVDELLKMEEELRQIKQLLSK